MPLTSIPTLLCSYFTMLVYNCLMKLSFTQRKALSSRSISSNKVLHSSISRYMVNDRNAMAVHSQNIFYLFTASMCNYLLYMLLVIIGTQQAVNGKVENVSTKGTDMHNKQLEDLQSISSSTRQHNDPSFYTYQSKVKKQSLDNPRKIFSFFFYPFKQWVRGHVNNGKKCKSKIFKKGKYPPAAHSHTENGNHLHRYSHFLHSAPMQSCDVEAFQVIDSYIEDSTPNYAPVASSCRSSHSSNSSPSTEYHGHRPLPRYGMPDLQHQMNLPYKHNVFPTSLPVTSMPIDQMGSDGYTARICQTETRPFGDQTLVLVVCQETFNFMCLLSLLSPRKPYLFQMRS